MTGSASKRARLPGQPERVGSFALLRKLGEGASGVVVLAYDETFNHRVALKVLHQHPADSPELRERVIAAARPLMRLSHPNLARIHDIGEFQGQLYVATEFIPGITVSDWIESDSPDWGEVLDVYIQAGRGLAAAHKNGVLHGAFRPEHVILRRDGQAFVIDFSPPGVPLDPRGGAAPAEGDSEGSSELNISAGALADAPEYMSPEQFLGKPGDARSEQFNFCASLWRGLMGERAFEGDSFDERARSVVSGKLNPPPRRSATPQWVVAALRRGMSPEPSARFPSMDALLEVLSGGDGPAVKRRTPRWIDPILIVVLFSLVSIAVTKAAFPQLVFIPAPVDAVLAEQLDASVVAARDAAARREWVYPAGLDHDPELPRTALQHVLAVEKIEGEEGAKNPASRAKELRKEFAHTLRALGDAYWEVDGGRAFARDYYLQSRLFVDEDQQPRERAGVTPGWFAEFRAKAEAAAFTEPEVASAEPLRLLSDPDIDGRVSSLTEYVKRSRGIPSAMQIDLATLLGEEPEEAPADEGQTTGGDAGAPAESATGEDPTDTEIGASAAEGAGERDTAAEGEAPEAEAEVDEAAPGEPATPDELEALEALEGDEEPDEVVDPPLDRKAARKLSLRLMWGGNAALDREEFTRAERLYKRALELDPRNHWAHHGLYALYFVTGKYSKARAHVRKAVALAPKSAKYRLDLGDLYLQSGMTSAARKAFEAAEELGEVEAARKRLDALPAEPAPE